LTRQKGEIAVLKAILQKNPELIAARDEIGRSPLHKTLAAGQGEAARFLIEARADVNRRDAEGTVPLGHAALMGDAAVAEMLIARGAKADVQDTALGAARCMRS
jgi:ankyrin repeat protein